MEKSQSQFSLTYQRLLILSVVILRMKLKYYGLNETSLNWCCPYLHDRYQYTKHNGTCSDVINLTTGVPQGSIPCFYYIYTYIYIYECYTCCNIKFLSPMCSFSLSNSLKPTNLTELTNSIKNELSHAHEWLLVNKLSFIVSKTKFVIFHHQQPRITILIPDLKLAFEPIEHFWV